MSAPSVAGAAAPDTDQERGWLRCPGCSTLLYSRRLAKDLMVCSECGHHLRIPLRERIAQLTDPGSYTPVDHGARTVDRLGFVDSRPYPGRLAEARERTGLDVGAVCGVAAVQGRPLVVAGLDFAYLGGSMGAAEGEVVTVAAELALARRLPLLVVAASGGARMQEGCYSLMQMAKTSRAFADLREAGVLSVCLLTDPTFGGVTASFATLGDVLLAEPGALIGFAGPRVIANATREKLPEGFQTAEYLFGRGLLDRVEPRDGLRPLLGRLLAAAEAAGTGPGAGGSADQGARQASDELPDTSPDSAPQRASQPPSTAATPATPATPAYITDPDAVPRRAAAECLRVARDIERPTTADYLAMICDDFVELHGDRLGGDDAAIVGGPALLAGRWVMALGHQKGHNTAELVARNFGMAGPEGYRKAERLMRLAGRLGLPVVALVDTQGAAPGVAAEAGGQSWAISQALATMATVPVPVVAAVIGEGGSGGALALAVADTVLAQENACYSVISPESCSTILTGGPGRSADMAESLRITAADLLADAVVDGVVPEPPGGSQTDPMEAAVLLKRALTTALAELDELDGDRLRARRRLRFRAFGGPPAAAGQAPTPPAPAAGGPNPDDRERGHR